MSRGSWSSVGSGTWVGSPGSGGGGGGVARVNVDVYATDLRRDQLQHLPLPDPPQPRHEQVELLLGRHDHGGSPVVHPDPLTVRVRRPLLPVPEAEVLRP